MQLRQLISIRSLVCDRRQQAADNVRSCYVSDYQRGEACSFPFEGFKDSIAFSNVYSVVNDKPANTCE